MNPLSADALPGILIVDDTPINLRLLARMLTEHGYHARPVLSGEQALAAAQALPPDLILLDIRMPGMDGYEVCRHLKANPRTRDIPVLFISALSETEDKIRAFAAGGVDYVTKPFRLEEILARVETHLTLRRLRANLRQEIIERDNLIADLDAYAHAIAHDLRAPVASALAMTQQLESLGTQSPNHERRVFETTLAQSLRKMNSIIDELVLFAGVRTVEVEISPVAMGPIVDEAWRRVASTAEEAGAQIGRPESWPPALGHAPWLEEVWVHYLNNAITYGGSPPIIEVGATSTANDSVRFWVRDNGSGLTPEQQARLFTPITQLNQAHATGRELGMSIVQRIVTRQNGEVGVESPGVSGEGSLFYFTLASPKAEDV